MGYIYYFNVDTIYLKANYDKVLLNDFALALQAPVLEKEGELCVPLADLRKIFATVLTADVQDAQVQVSDGKTTVQAQTVEHNGVCFVSLDRLLCRWQGWRRMEKTSVENNHIVVFTNRPDCTAIPNLKIKYFDNLVRGRHVGDLYETYWFEEGDRLVPYHIYLPTDFGETEKTYPVIFYLHGGNGGPNQGFEKSHNMLQFHAEKNGYIVVGVDGFIKDATYGYILPPNPGDPSLDKNCPENPGHYSPERIAGHKLGETCLEQTIKTILRRYPVDPERMFLMGNSMGGEGTFWFACTHPGMFRAIVPAGAMINTDFVDLEPLRGLPILFLAGTDDMHGFDYLQNGVRKMEAYGLNISHVYVGGGNHPEGWSYALPEAFAFFNENNKPKA